jgi:6,7-dimethyl-8-ribityllumazine synthase
VAEIKTIEGTGSVSDARIAIVASRYNNYIVERLLSGCINTLHKTGITGERITVVRVPGAFEIPVAAGRLADRDDYDAIIALGAVIRGETPHFEYICNECAHGLAVIALQVDMPVIFGVLTVDTIGQAEDRSGDEESNKGCEAASTALEMIDVLRKLG